MPSPSPSSRRPLTDLPTHTVTNQPPPFEDVNRYTSDTALREAVRREGGQAFEARLTAFGERTGSAEVIRWAFEANRNRPELVTFDRYGQRLDEVVYHPAYHRLMALAVEAGMPSVAWSPEDENAEGKGPAAGGPPAGGHVAHAAFEFLMTQAEPGVCCPLSMTYAGVPALALHAPELAAELVPQLTARSYDPRFIPATEKTGLTLGMAMTEKQGGSDVRANRTRAHSLGGDQEYELVGHKWFCSAPMSDGFLTLAQVVTGREQAAEEGHLTCFYVPRWQPDGSRNPFFIQRLKDKLGDHANASSEIEYAGTWARRVGEVGRGVRTILEMVHHTRLDCIVAPAAMMRQAVANACWHTAHRRAFGKLLIDQPLMREVLADLTLESEAATALTFRVARSFDDSRTEGKNGERARLLSRLLTPIAKYWVNKRLPELAYEAMECHGGAGYIEEGVMPRIFRQSPLNSIWEGSGNVICLDVLRAMGREPQTVEILMEEIRLAAGADRRFDAFLARLEERWPVASRDESETRITPGDARRLCEDLALAVQASVLLRHAPAPVADAFCAGRLAGEGRCYGTLPSGVDLEALIERGRPRA